MHVGFLSILFAVAPGPHGDLGKALDSLRAVGPEGRGNRDAGRAWREVARAEPSVLPRILAAMNGTGELAANWIRAAVDAICERELARQGSLPMDELRDFVLDTRHHPRARRLAYEWISRFDSTVAERILGSLGDDPDAELRRDAVARVVEEAESLLKRNEKPKASLEFHKALRLARDDDQVRRVATRLRELGERVDLQRHFGFVSRWHVIGPFDNGGARKFNHPYPPERLIDLEATYAGKSKEIVWQVHTTEDDYGTVDLNRVLGRHKDAIAYALAEFESDATRNVEIRLASVVAWKIWVNGEFLFGHEEYHHGMELDQFRVKARFRRGGNRILVKLCQNGQTEDWAQHWKFQLRVCDAAGTAVLPASARSAPTAPEGKS